MTPSPQALAAAKELFNLHLVDDHMELNDLAERLDCHFPTAAWRELAKQTGDLLFQMECAATMEMGFDANHPMLKDVRKALEAVES